MMARLRGIILKWPYLRWLGSKPESQTWWHWTRHDCFAIVFWACNWSSECTCAVGNCQIEMWRCSNSCSCKQPWRDFAISAQLGTWIWPFMRTMWYPWADAFSWGPDLAQCIHQIRGFSGHPCRRVGDGMCGERDAKHSIKRRHKAFSEDIWDLKCTCI